MPTKPELEKQIQEATRAIEKAREDARQAREEAEGYAEQLRTLEADHRALLEGYNGLEENLQKLESEAREEAGDQALPAFVRWTETRQTPGGCVSPGMVQRAPSLEALQTAAHVRISQEEWLQSPNKWESGTERPGLRVL